MVLMQDEEYPLRADDLFADGFEIGSLLRIRDFSVHATLSALFGVFPLASLTVLMLSVPGTKPIVIHVGSECENDLQLWLG